MKALEKSQPVEALILSLIAVIFLLSPPVSASEYFHDDFSAFSGWTYLTTQGEFAATDGYAYVSDWQGTDTIIAEKSLSAALSSASDFTITLDIGVLSDTYGMVGSFGVSLLDSSSNVVAHMHWFDAQAWAGYGGVDFYAQGETAIFRSDPSGFATDYPTFSGTMSITRSGSEWAAWVNGAQKGTNITLSATLDATTMQIFAARATGWSEREFQVNDLVVVPEVVPEPSSLILVGVGLSALLYGVRFRKSERG